MDIHVTAEEPTREERDAVDSVLGKAESGWSGGQRHIELEGRFAFGGHTDRARRHVASGSACHPKAGGLDQSRCAELCQREARHPAG